MTDDNDTYDRPFEPVRFSECGKCGGFYRLGPNGTTFKEAPFASACSCLEPPTVQVRRVTHARCEIREIDGVVTDAKQGLVDLPTDVLGTPGATFTIEGVVIGRTHSVEATDLEKLRQALGPPSSGPFEIHELKVDYDDPQMQAMATALAGGPVDETRVKRTVFAEVGLKHLIAAHVLNVPDDLGAIPGNVMVRPDDALVIGAEECDPPGACAEHGRCWSHSTEVVPMVGGVPAEDLLQLLRWDVDMLAPLPEYEGELWWLGPSLDEQGKRVGITGCCPAAHPCEHHATMMKAKP